MSSFDGYNIEQLKQNLEIVLALEYLGIHIEDTKEETDKYGISSKTIYYFSVPERSTIEVKDEDSKEKVKTSDGLISIAKESLTEMVIDSCKAEFSDDEEFIEEVKNNISDYLKFYAKVRTGEVWSKELGEEMIKKISDEIKAASGYKEV